jgi:hypothetical protein
MTRLNIILGWKETSIENVAWSHEKVFAVEQFATVRRIAFG